MPTYKGCVEMRELVKKKCMPCVAGTSPLKGEELKNLSQILSDGWEVIDGHHLEKKYTFGDFKQSLHFINILGKISDEEKHYPSIFIAYGTVTLQIWTEALDGLTENDFILAAKIEAEYISHETT